MHLGHLHNAMWRKHGLPLGVCFSPSTYIQVAQGGAALTEMQCKHRCPCLQASLQTGPTAWPL